ncbi:cupin domain-containing protein [Patescibacteria group bacterium]|nr:cupin domain-containing protein [Patescibacteria group bacterium]
MSGSASIYQKIKKIFDGKIASCFIYYMKPGVREPKHYHKAIEIELVLKGNCKTHQQGKLYMYKKGQVHEVINNSKNPLVFICLTIPQENEQNTIYI